jgi:hypothetical protein
MCILLSGVPAVPRTNSSSPASSNRNRSRGPAPSPQKSRTVDAAADMPTSTVDASSNDNTSYGSTNDKAPYNPTYDEIAEAAYQRYLRRGGGDGQDFDDWVEAERELRSLRSS